MAEAIVGPLLSKLQQVAVDEAQALAAVGGEIDKLRDRLMWLQGLVHETDLRSRLDGSRLVRVLACQTRDAAFEAEDAIDLFYLQGDLSRRFGRDWPRAAWHLVRNVRTHVCIRFTLSRSIQSLNERLQQIVDNSTKYSGIQDDSSGKRWRACRAIPPMRHGWDEEYRVPFKLHVRYDEKGKLAEKLNSKLDAPEVIPVVGVGGVGKRALLRHAYEDLKKCFDVRILVSFPPDIVETSMMVKQVDETLSRECRSLWKDQATKEGVRYLVVIESPVNATAWSKLEPRLLEKMAGKPGSKIRILVPVTSSPDDVQGSGIKMKALVNRESITLFNKVYGLKGRRGTKYQTMEMNKIRDNIMEITGGYPLAVVLLAKLMRTMDLSKWEAAAEYMKSSNEDSKLQSILSVCVDDLPDELKSCLLLTAGFPVGQEIDAQQLVRLWMAEGFLARHHGLETERLGQCYLRELIYRGLLQLVHKTSSSAHGEGGGGRVERVAIHDQIHPLLISEAQRTSFMDIHYGGCIPVPSNTRRLALHRYNHKLDAFSNGLGKLRTLVSCSESGHPKDTEAPTFKVRKLFKGSPYLRVINLEGIDVVGSKQWWKEGGQAFKLPRCIGEMVHLQYLGVRIPNLEKLPSSVGNLSQLQTIDVRDTKVRKLPKRVWKIKTLRHVLGDCLAFPRCTGDDDLKLMQTLEAVSIKAMPAKATKRGKKSRSGGGLGPLQRLHVVELEDEESQRMALATILADLSSSLNSLKLSGSAIPTTNLFAGASGPCLRNVESLELHGNLTVPQHASEENRCYCFSCCLVNSHILNRLTRLVLRSTGINQEFITHAISKLPDLDELDLQDGSYVDTNLVLCTHGFRSLKVLQVSGLPELGKIVVDDRQVMVMAYHVKIETHESCDDCPPQNKGRDGVSSHATTEKDANQSPLKDIEEMILAAVDNKGSSETAIKDYIKKKYGDIVHLHLEHMVHSQKLHVTRGRYDKYDRPKVEQAGPQHDSSSAGPDKNKQIITADGGSSPATTEEDVSQSLLEHLDKRILEAIDSNRSSKTAIKGYIKDKYGDIVHEHLELMVRLRKLHVTDKPGHYNIVYSKPKAWGAAAVKENENKKQEEAAVVTQPPVTGPSRSGSGCS